MSVAVTVNEAANRLGVSTSAVRQRVKAGTLKGRKTTKGVIIYLEDEDSSEAELIDPIAEVADELIMLGKRLKRAVKDHDDYVRRETITEIGIQLADSAKKG
jgi:predicted site-specific integrase-resolvase